MRSRSHCSAMSPRESSSAAPTTSRWVSLFLGVSIETPSRRVDRHRRLRGCCRSPCGGSGPTRSPQLFGTRPCAICRRYREAATAHAEAISLNPDFQSAYGERGLAFYGLGDLERARATCEAKRDDWVSQQCLAVVYEKLGRHGDAGAELAKMKAALGDALAYQYATIYAQWGDRAKALEWLDVAMGLRDPGLENLKTEPFFDPLRKEPRFQAI